MYDLTETMEETTMKRNLLIAIAVTAFMLATTIAQAADFEFSGKFRPRFEIQGDANNANSSRPQWDTRARLNAKAKINANTEVFLQFQARGIWGNAGASSGTRAASPANDAVDDVGLHQGYVTLKNFMGKEVDLKLGRQEIVFEGHRLFGNTIWTQGGQTNDAVRFNHAAGNHELNFLYIEALENGNVNAGADRNKAMWVARAATQGVLGGNLAGYFVAHDDESAESGNNQWYTMGARQAGKMNGLDYRVEYYHQFGDGAVPATSSSQSGAYAGTITNDSEIDRDAYLFGIRVGKTFKNARFSPTITLWYDEKSGNDDDDVNGNDYGGYNTVQDTGHKFYGLLDNYLSDIGDDTQRYGLQDIAIKGKFNLNEKNTFKIDWHQFLTQTDLEGNDSDTIRAAGGGAFATGGNNTGALGNDLGQEIDLTLVHKYDSNTKIVTGYSHYFTTTTHSLLNGSGAVGAGGGDNTKNNNDDQSWFYMMIDTTF
jgi:hypothetical protein